MRLTVILAILLTTRVSASAEDSARVFVYEQRQTAASSWLPIFFDSAVVAKLNRGKFFAISVTPGRHSLSLEGGVPITVEARSGEELFVRLDWNFGMNRPPIPALSAVRPEKARAEMKFLNYIDSKKILSGRVAKTDPREPEPLRFKRRDQQ